MLDSNDTLTTQAHFERLCDGLEDYEHLPEFSVRVADVMSPASDSDHEDSINAEILAGLVRP